ncbi:hypothetical protein ATN37_03470 [Rhodococcus sp. MH15]|uniref:DUF3644 domain-containing protein n=1 Tax=Rhodococcus TaxID=1827 RepID=UPI001C4F296E|nr:MULTISPECIES: DUF3644 domain-containing protein [Rhodococcus]MBW0288827.1 hypothetical protein [Rhodococcus sp. MH15]MCT6736333.1 DUF3644 domain-containing protein [Rhodococcus qingshengii]
MARPPRWQSTLDASAAEACLAVRMYNDAAESRSFEAFVIHMHLAWLYLLHAGFIRDGKDFRYWDKRYKSRLLKIDGEAKCWELERSLRERWPDENDPIRANLSLFIRLRNRLEHRHAHADEALMLNLSGQAHALLLNFEDEMTSQFGDEQSLALRLRIPLFVGTFSPQGEQALRRLRKTLPKDLQGFLTNYEAGLDDAVVKDPRYEFRLRATVELAPKDPDAVAVQFTHYNDMTSEERAAVEEMGRKGQVIVRDRKQPVSGLGRLMPKAAAAEVQDGVPYAFNQTHFTAAWKNLQARPLNGAKNPEHTNPDWCEYDEPTGSYRYTRAFVKHLQKKCATAEGFKSVTGIQPKPKPSSDN